MLIIRTAQMAALRRAAGLSEDRLDRLIAHFQAHFPRHDDVQGRLLCRAGAADRRMARAELALRIRAACDEAASLGLCAEAEQMRYLNVCGALAWDFLRAPEYRGVAAMLEDKRVTSPGERLRRAVLACMAQAEMRQHNAALVGRPWSPYRTKDWYE